MCLSFFYFLFFSFVELVETKLPASWLLPPYYISLHFLQRRTVSYMSISSLPHLRKSTIPQYHLTPSQYSKFFQIPFTGTSPAVQWLRLHALIAGVKSLIPGQGTKIPHAVLYGLKNQRNAFYSYSIFWTRIGNCVVPHVFHLVVISLSPPLNLEHSHYFFFLI